MWYCLNCKSEIEKPLKRKTTFEAEYGVSHLFPTSHEIEILVCPVCKDDGCLEEMKKCDYCGEWNKEEDLTDTEGLTGGGVGVYCCQCIKDCDIGG